MGGGVGRPVALAAVVLAVASAQADERSEALARFAARDDGAAIQRLTALVEHAPDDVELLTALGRAEFRAGDTQAALNHLRHAHELAPDDLALGIRLSVALGRRIDEVNPLRKLLLAREVGAVLTDVVARHPESADAREGLLIFHLGAPVIVGGDLAEARRQVEAMGKIDACHGLIGQAEWLQHQGRNAESIELLRQAVSANPGSADARFDLGQALASEGRVGEAIDTWQALLRLDPKQARARYRIAATAVASGQELARGEAALREYLASGPSDDEDPTLGDARTLMEQLVAKSRERGDRPASVAGP